MRKPSREFQRIVDILAGIFLIMFFLDFILWMGQFDKGGVGAFIFISGWGWLFTLLFVVSLYHFFKKLTIKKSVYSVSSKFIIISCISWLSFPWQSPHIYLFFSPLLIFYFIFLLLISYKFLKWADRNGKITGLDSLTDNFLHPKVDNNCKELYASKFTAVAFLLSFILISLWIFSMLYGAYADQSIRLNIGAILLFSLIFIFQISIFSYLTVLVYAEEGVYGAILLAGGFIYSSTYLLRNISAHPISSYTVVLIFFLFSAAIAVELFDEWAQRREEEKKIDRKEWLTFK